ncbi:MAG: hypothetical protein IID51_05945 [Proteobacteria bacterium]|nr:hypothetical protein [Pseudomonadota bacterium]
MSGTEHRIYHHGKREKIIRWQGRPRQENRQGQKVGCDQEADCAQSRAKEADCTQSRAQEASRA